MIGSNIESKPAPAMVEKERPSTSSELGPPIAGEVDDDQVATTSRAGAAVEARLEEVDALKDMDRVGPEKEIQEAQGSTPTKMPSGEEACHHGSTLAEGSSASAGVQPGEVDRMETHEFGRILQTSQWSLRHRIKVCKVLECSGHDPLTGEYNVWMTPLISRHEYAKQSLALVVDRPHGIILNDISILDWPSLEELSWLVEEMVDKERELDFISDSIRVERSIWAKYLSELRNDMMARHVFEDWKELRERLEEELDNLREKDTQEEWYKHAFGGKDTKLQSWEIYAAIEEGDVVKMHELMAEIGKEHWGKLKPREFRGATPLHWAALHNRVDQTLWDLIDSDPWPEELFDDFGFKPVHMAIFASSFLPASHTDDDDDVSRCLSMIDGYAAILKGERSDPEERAKMHDIVDWDLPRKNPTYGWNFEVCPLTRSIDHRWTYATGLKDTRFNAANKDKFFVFREWTRQRKVEDSNKSSSTFSHDWNGGCENEHTFVARCYFSTPIHPLHLAIWIGHPLLVEKLIHSFKGMSYFSNKTDSGDTVLHLAFKAMDFARSFEYSGQQAPPEYHDLYESAAYTGMHRASREQVMKIMMRYLHYYPHMLNSQNEDGQTPLHIAIFRGNLSCVRALLRCDYANYNIRNNKGLTPIDMVLKLDTKDLKEHRKYTSILERRCILSEEVAFTTVECSDFGYLVNYDTIVDFLMEELACDIVRQRRILQLSQWSDKHRIYALQMLAENPVGLEGVKHAFVKQCVSKMLDKYHQLNFEFIRDVGKIIGDANEMRRLTMYFIEETARQYSDKQFEYGHRILAAIEDGDKNEFNMLIYSSRGEICSMRNRSNTFFSEDDAPVAEHPSKSSHASSDSTDSPAAEHPSECSPCSCDSTDTSVRPVMSSKEEEKLNPSYKEANFIHWAILHGESAILDSISRNEALLESYKISMGGRNKGRKIVNMTDGFGFTCIHFALFYSLFRSSDRYKPILQFDERFIARYIDRYPLAHSQVDDTYNKMVDKLHEMDFDFENLDNNYKNYGVSTYYTPVQHHSDDFVVWSITPEDGIHVNNYLTQTCSHPIYLAVHCAQPKGFKRILSNTSRHALTKCKLETRESILHNAEGWEGLMRHCSKDEWRQIEFSLMESCVWSDVNARNWNRETPLHKAVRTKNPEWVELLLQSDNIRFDLRDRERLTPGDRAAKMREETPSNAEVQEIIDLLDCYDPESWPRKKEMEFKRQRDEENKMKDDQLKLDKQIEEERRRERDQDKKRRDEQLEREKSIEEERKKTEGLQRERQVYVDAGNAILVGGALIASASFGAWLQPPLGLHPYYSPEFLDTSAPPPIGPVYDSYVAIQQHRTIHAFWILNSLSFFLSLATVIAGADAALPREGLDDQKALNSVKKAVKIEAWLLIASIVAVVGTFAMVGFTVLPPKLKYHINMICTLVIGGLVCLVILIRLLRKLCS